MVVEQAEGRLPEDVGVEPLLSVLVLKGLLPVGGRELQDAADGPAGEEAEEVAEVGPGLDVVELAAGEEGDEGGVDLGGVVGADEEPVLAADGLAPQGALGGIVVERETAIVEEALERDPLIAGVADGLGDRRLVEDPPASASHQAKKASTMGLDSARRAANRASAEAVADARSTRNSPPMNASAWRARSGSVSSALKKYRRACAQHATSIKVPRLYRWSKTACASATR